MLSSTLPQTLGLRLRGQADVLLADNQGFVAMCRRKLASRKYCSLKAAESDRDAMKKQATSLSEEYDRLADTYSKLQKDFDKAKGLQGSDKKSD